MKSSVEINEIAAAMAKAQAMLKPAHKESVNPAYRSKYADLASVWAAWQEAGPQCGLAVWQDVTTLEAGISVSTLITHASGQWMEFGPLVVPLAKHDAHGVGSATTYGKRFGLSASLGIVADDDDDGNAAVGTPPQKLPGYYQRPAPKSNVDPALVGRPDRPSGPPTTEQDAKDALPGPEKDRAFYEDAIKRKVAKLSAQEKQALKDQFLHGQMAGDASVADLQKLYLFLGDAAAVSQWQAEVKRGTA